MKFGLLFAHQVPPESGIASQETYWDMLQCLPRAEELGYVSALQCSHHVQKDGFCPGPLVAMAGAAAVTERMRIGTAVLLVPLYAPLRLAEDVAVIDNLSGGRFIFGVAPGYVTQEFAAHGVPREERIGRFEEALDLMIQAWSGEPFSFEGRYYRVVEGRVTPRPVQRPHPPIWYGVSAPGSLHRAAARRCVQIMSPRHGLAELEDHFRPYEAAAAEADWTIPERPIIRQVFVAPTMAEAKEKAAPAVNYLYRELYGAASAAGDRVLRRDDGSVIDDPGKVAFETFKDRYIIGDPDFAIRRIRDYQAAVNPSDMICWMHMPGVPGADAMASPRALRSRGHASFQLTSQSGLTEERAARHERRRRLHSRGGAC